MNERKTGCFNHDTHSNLGTQTEAKLLILSIATLWELNFFIYIMKEVAKDWKIPQNHSKSWAHHYQAFSAPWCHQPAPVDNPEYWHCRRCSWAFFSASVLSTISPFDDFNIKALFCWQVQQRSNIGFVGDTDGTYCCQSR